MAIPDRYKTWSGEWIYQEIKDWKNIRSLQEIAKQQAANAEASAHAAQRQAEADEDLAEAAERQAEAAEHRIEIEKWKASETVAATRERLRIELDRRGEEKERQRLKGELFDLEQRIEAVQKSESNPLSSFLAIQRVLTTLQSMSVRSIGDHHDMTLHAQLVSQSQELIDGARQKASSDIKAFDALVADSQDVGEAAIALDSFWKRSQISPLRKKHKEFGAELTNVECQKRQKQEELENEIAKLERRAKQRQEELAAELSKIETQVKGARERSEMSRNKVVVCYAAIVCGFLLTITTNGLGMFVASVLLIIAAIFGVVAYSRLSKLQKKEAQKLEQEKNVPRLGLKKEAQGIEQEKEAERLKLQKEAQNFKHALARHKSQIEGRMASVEAIIGEIPQSPFRELLSDIKIPVPERWRRTDVYEAGARLVDGLHRMKETLIAHPNIRPRDLSFAGPLRGVDFGMAEALLKKAARVTGPCPECRAILVFTLDASGKTGSCPHCQKEIVFPRVSSKIAGRKDDRK